MSNPRNPSTNSPLLEAGHPSSAALPVSVFSKNGLFLYFFELVFSANASIVVGMLVCWCVWCNDGHGQTHDREMQPRPLPSSGKVETGPRRNDIMVMAWNVENLFDTHDDPLTDDDDYTPRGKMQWDAPTLAKKLANITEVIRRVNNNLGPDILGLAEVENIALLKRLAQHPNLASLGYRYHYLKDAEDPRGIDVGMLSRYPAKVFWHKVYYGSRYILEAHFTIRSQLLYVIMNHWRSRIGGRKESEHYRIDAAQKCLDIVTNIASKNPQADIIVMGDFNDNPTDVSLRQNLHAVPYSGKLENGLLYNITRTVQPPRGIVMPNYYDQIILSRGMWQRAGFSYIPKSFQIIAYPFMLTREGLPRSFSLLDRSGYSDHFPVVARFAVR